jgi:hypothetical protein
MVRKTKKEKEEELRKAITRRVLDIYAGAIGDVRNYDNGEVVFVSELKNIIYALELRLGINSCMFSPIVDIAKFENPNDVVDWLMRHKDCFTMEDD